MFRSKSPVLYRQLVMVQLRKQHKATSDLNHAISEAEKIVGYPTSFLNLRWLLTDELANVALHFRRLITTNHPLLDTARKIFIGNKLPAWGLIILLISKAGGLVGQFSSQDQDMTAGILHSQRVLAEVTEMIRMSHFIHKSLLNIDKNIDNDLNLNFGNKIALLSGDILLGKSYHELACMRNQDLNELMASALRDLVDAEFIPPRDHQDMPLPNKPTNLQADTDIPDHFDTKPYSVNNLLGNPYTEWTVRNILGGASLLGKSCQGTLKLARHSQSMQELGYLFGKNVALAWQMQIELEAFTENHLEKFSLVSAPVMFHLQYDPSSYEKIEKGLHNVQEVDYNDMRRTIQDGPALEQTKKIKRKFLTAALDVLNQFPHCDARTALTNIINVML